MMKHRCFYLVEDFTKELYGFQSIFKDLLLLQTKCIAFQKFWISKILFVCF